MSFFIGGLAFTDPALEAGMEIGGLGGSILSAALGFVLLRFALPRVGTAERPLREQAGSRCEAYSGSVADRPLSATAILTLND